MATVLTDTGKNAFLSGGFAAKALYASLHSADPSTTGANEIAASGRKALSWGTATAGSFTATAASAFNVASGVAVAYIGVWDASSAGNFVASYTVPTETFGSAGTYTVSGVTESVN